MMSHVCFANSSETLTGLRVQKHHLYPSVQFESELVTFKSVPVALGDGAKVNSSLINTHELHVERF